MRQRQLSIARHHFVKRSPETQPFGAVMGRSPNILRIQFSNLGFSGRGSLAITRLFLRRWYVPWVVREDSQNVLPCGIVSGTSSQKRGICRFAEVLRRPSEEVSSASTGPPVDFKYFDQTNPPCISAVSLSKCVWGFERSPVDEFG